MAHQPRGLWKKGQKPDETDIKNYTQNGPPASRTLKKQRNTYEVKIGRQPRGLSEKNTKNDTEIDTEIAPKELSKLGDYKQHVITIN